MFQINLFCQEKFPLWKFGRGCEWDILKGPVSHNWQLVFKLTLLFFVLMVVFQEIWTGILSNPDIVEDTDFFKAGAGSMDVTR